MKSKNQLWQKASALFLSILLVTAIPLQALAVEQDPATDPIPLTEEAATYLVTLKNFDGNETLQTLSVGQDATLTLADINAQLTAPAREGYVFMGWSTAQGNVLPNATMKDSWVISADTTLYAVYRTIGSQDVDVGLLVDTMDAIEAMDTAVNKYGISLKTVLELPKRDAQFYEYLEEYLQSRAPEVMAASERTARNASVGLSGQRMQHAYDDATWSTQQHKDLDFTKELLYMYTAHYIDKEFPFGGTQVGCDVNFLEQYITDMDRGVYANFYRTASGIDVYKSIFDLISTACSTPDLLRAKNITSKKWSGIVDGVASIWSGEDQGKTLHDDLVAKNANNLKKIATMNDEDKEKLFQELDALFEETKNDIIFDHGDDAETIVKYNFFGIVAVARGGGVLGVIGAYAGIYNTFFVSLIDQANFVGMRSSIHARVPNRILYYYGMNNGRD